ncbi:LPS assembly protein LptD [Luteolibacter ambystomatis]|uniref:LPS assembly protein LptD n=1 Tax=Luteolibacter ambystomatis TaxID=2824561 RepID=A0A975IYZ9_9BACT|nr:LPS assembly protein LptD [Luteolibacter ambystomatis]QUE50762.1 LPS assembly protein LptD [Luteolibacter ambystomatis]
MRIKAGAPLLPLLFTLPLLAQEVEVLPNPGGAPPVDKIQPVPPPSIPFTTPETTTPTLPKDVVVTNVGGGQIQYDQPTGLLTYSSAVHVTTDNGTVLDARSAVANLNAKTIELAGPVKALTDNKIEIFADRAVVDTNTKTITMIGNVSVYQGNMLQRGQQAVYDYGRKSLDATGLRSSVDPLLLEAGKFSVDTDAEGKQVFRGEDAGITTNDVEDPNYWIRAKRTTVYPGDKVVFENLRFYAGDTPVFWLPYLSQPLNKELGYHIVPGARSNWGPFLLNTYGIMLGGERDPKTGETKDEWLLSKWHLDLRGSRGVGTGVDLIDTRVKDNPNLGWLNLYYLYDLDPSIQRSGIPRLPIDNDRYLAQFKYRIPFQPGDDAEWYVDANLTRISDQYYLEDFDPKAFRTNPFPDNTLGVFRNDGASLASFYTRLRLNDFYRSDQRVELAYDQARTPIFGTQILHEGSTSVGIYGEETGDPTRNAVILPLLTLPPGDPRIPGLLAQLPPYERLLVQQIRALPPGNAAIPSLANQLLDPSYSRFHTYHEFSMPLNIGGWLTIVPEVGAGLSRYWDVSGPQDAITRAYVETGAEASVKFSKDYENYQNRALGLDGLLHVIQPYARWSMVNADDLDSSFPKIDRLSFSTRPQTLDLGRFTAIDDIADWNIIRLGMRNRLITHRDGQSYEWLYLDTYMDAFIGDDPQNLGRSVSNLYNDARWRPLPWMSVDLETQFPVVSDGNGYSELSPRLRFMPTPDFEFSIGDRLLNNHPVLPDSNRVDFRAYARIHEDWGFGMLHVWELDDHTLELQQYTISHDLGNWVAGVGFTKRDNRVHDEYGVIFSLTLKDFPDVTLPFEIDTDTAQ